MYLFVCCVRVCVCVCVSECGGCACACVWERAWVRVSPCVCVCLRIDVSLYMYARTAHLDFNTVVVDAQQPSVRTTANVGGCACVRERACGCACRVCV